MDFLYCSDFNRLTEVRAALAKAALPAFEFSGSAWGCFVGTATPYKSLAPAIVDGQLHAVVCDPLVAGAHSDSPFGRTELIARRWGADPGSVVPNHPAALIRISTGRPSIDILTDAWGAVGLYYLHSERAFYLSTTPDLIALAAGCKVDRDSAIEFLSATQIAFPNTLFDGVYQIPPASASTLSEEGVASKRYWSPPKPDASITLEDARTRVQQVVRSTYSRIRDEVASSGLMTLSAGMDSRFLSSVALRDAVLDIEGITISPMRNVEYWLSKRAAHLLGLRLTARAPKPGAFNRRMLKNSPAVPSHIDRRCAHFAEQALGSVDAAFLIGGYMADTVLQFSDPFYGARQHYLWSKRLPPDSPRWALTSFSGSVPADVSARISARWDKSDQLLGITSEHTPTLTTAYPAQRQGHFAQFEAGRREYPMYEPFITRDMLDLGFALPIQVKKQNAKHAFYAPYLNGLLDGMMAPGAAEEIVKRVNQRFKETPRDRWPSYAKFNSAWGSAPSQDGSYFVELAKASKIMPTQQPGDYSQVPQQIVFQLWKAMEVSADRS